MFPGCNHRTHKALPLPGRTIVQMIFCRFTRLLLCILFGVITAFPLSSQVRPGIKFGMSTPDVSPRDFIVTDGSGVLYYDVFVKDARYGVHAGAFIQMQMGSFFIQPEILFNSTSVDYRIDQLFNPDLAPDEFRDTYRNIDFPLILGLKAGAFRLGAGPVGHIYLESEGGFSKYPDYSRYSEDLTWGWQAGVGLDLWKLHIDARYEGNFTNLGDHITFFGKTFDFATRNNRMIASLGFSF